jgi:hypothetical protein
VYKRICMYMWVYVGVYGCVWVYADVCMCVFVYVVCNSINWPVHRIGFHRAPLQLTSTTAIRPHIHVTRSCRVDFNVIFHLPPSHCYITADGSSASVS